MILTIDEMIQRDLTPLDVWDANGMEIDHPITKFDTETGEVEFFVTDKEKKLPDNEVHITSAGDRFVFNEEGSEFLRKSEKFPAPLTWISRRK